MIDFVRNPSSDGLMLAQIVVGDGQIDRHSRRVASVVRIKKPLSDFLTLLSFQAHRKTKKESPARSSSSTVAAWIFQELRRTLQTCVHNALTNVPSSHPPSNPTSSFKILTRHRCDRYIIVAAASRD